MRSEAKSVSSRSTVTVRVLENAEAEIRVECDDLEMVVATAHLMALCAKRRPGVPPAETFAHLSKMAAMCLKAVTTVRP